MHNFDQMRRIFRTRVMAPSPITITVKPEKRPHGDVVEYNGFLWWWSAWEREDGYVDVVLSNPRERADFDWPQ